MAKKKKKNVLKKKATTRSKVAKRGVVIGRKTISVVLWPEHFDLIEQWSEACNVKTSQAIRELLVIASESRKYALRTDAKEIAKAA